LGYTNKKKIDDIKFEIENLTDSNEISNLAYLISIGLLEIKIAFSEEGILHDKFGFISDGENEVYFRGSANETVAAVKKNVESFETSVSWSDAKSERMKIINAKNKFESIWNNNYPSLFVVDLPNIIKNKILSFNKKKLIINYSLLYKDQFVIDIDENNKFFLVNNLKNNSIMDNYSLNYKIYLERHISYIRGNSYFVNTDSYLKIEKLISDIKDLSIENSFNFVVTNKVFEFLKDKSIHIEKRMNTAIAIKERNSLVLDQFNSFKEIVNNETIRKLNIEQMWNAFHISTLSKAANFSVPGTGKTAISYGVFSYLTSKKINKVNRMIVVGPLSSFFAWKDEFEKIFQTKKQLRFLNLNDNFPSKNSKKNLLKYKFKEYNLILINYDSLNGYVEELSDLIDNRTLLVFDEAHKIKNPEGIRAGAALLISKNSKYTITLTGTPIPNSYTDIYNLLNILFPNEYDTFFGYSIKKLQNATKDEFLQDEINKRLFPFFCRITKKDLEIPPPNKDNLIKVSMNTDERRLFKLIYDKYQHNIFSLYIRLSQATNNPKLILQNISKFDDINSFEDEDSNQDENSSNVFEKETFSQKEKKFIESFNMTQKFDKGIELITKLVKEGKKVIVWGVFVKTIEEIGFRLNKLKIKTVVITGKTQVSDRDSLISQFKDSKYQVLVTNPHTLGESVSLHKYCHDAIYFEYTFNLVHMLQSRDRIHRLGLTPSDYTQYHYLALVNDKEIIYDSIDLKTYNRLKMKEQRMLNAIESNILFSKDSSFEDDIRFILNQI
jgi:SNF2 family DNA or RNA helicase